MGNFLLDILISLCYSDITIIEVDKIKLDENLKKINRGCVIIPDLRRKNDNITKF